MIKLPKVVADLYFAQKAMCRHFSSSGLKFTLDGRLVGDIAEAIVSDAYGLKLCANRTPGVDAHAPNGKSVQIKSTGKMGSGPAYTPGEGFADYLIFIRIDFAEGSATVLYNGPEAPVRQLLPGKWSGTKTIPLSKILKINKEVNENDRLKRL